MLTLLGRSAGQLVMLIGFLRSIFHPIHLLTARRGPGDDESRLAIGSQALSRILDHADTESNATRTSARNTWVVILS